MVPFTAAGCPEVASVAFALGEMGGQRTLDVVNEIDQNMFLDAGEGDRGKRDRWADVLDDCSTACDEMDAGLWTGSGFLRLGARCLTGL